MENKNRLLVNYKRMQLGDSLMEDMNRERYAVGGVGGGAVTPSLGSHPLSTSVCSPIRKTSEPLWLGFLWRLHYVCRHN